MPLTQLWWQFIKIGVAAFGGLGVTLSLIERYLINDRRVLKAQDVTESLTLRARDSDRTFHFLCADLDAGLWRRQCGHLAPGADLRGANAMGYAARFRRRHRLRLHYPGSRIDYLGFHWLPRRRFGR